MCWPLMPNNFDLFSYYFGLPSLRYRLLCNEKRSDVFAIIFDHLLCLHITGLVTHLMRRLNSVLAIPASTSTLQTKVSNKTFKEKNKKIQIEDNKYSLKPAINFTDFICYASNESLIRRLSGKRSGYTQVLVSNLCFDEV